MYLYVVTIFGNYIKVNYIGYCPIPANIEIPSAETDKSGQRGNNQREQTINTLTITQERIEIFTKTSQYLLALDLVSNLFLHVEPGIKERWERQLLRRFQLQLSDDLTAENIVREMQTKLEVKVIELQKTIRRELEHVRKQEYLLYHSMAEQQATKIEIANTVDKDEINHLEKKLEDVNYHIGRGIIHL